MRTNVHPFSDVCLLRPGEDLLATLREGVDAIGGISKYVHPGDTVFIKPNLTAGMPASTGGTTDVFFAEAVVELVKEAQPGRILVGECSGNESRSIESLTNCGYIDMGKRQGVEILDLDKAEFVDVHVDRPLYREIVHMPKAVMEADVFISLPVLKNHVSVGITVAMKNSFGLVPDDDKLNAHRNNAVEEILVDIAKARRADLIFADGRIGAEGIAGGTHFKKPIAANLIMVGNDPVAIDAVAARVMDQNPRVRYIQWAAMEGLGYDNLDYIKLHGLSIEEAKVHFLTPAEEITGDSQGKVRLCDLESCSKCRAAAEGAMSRFSAVPASLLATVDVVYGPGKWDVPSPVNPRTLLLGDCIRPEYRALGHWIPGCPVDSEAYMKAMSDFDVVCTKCMDATQAVMARFTEEELKEIRVLAANRTIFRGANNKAAVDDLLLAIGDCQAGYCRNHARRGHKISDVDFDKTMVFQPGCPPTADEIENSLREILSRAKER